MFAERNLKVWGVVNFFLPLTAQQCLSLLSNNPQLRGQRWLHHYCIRIFLSLVFSLSLSQSLPHPSTFAIHIKFMCKIISLQKESLQIHLFCCDCESCGFDRCAVFNSSCKTPKKVPLHHACHCVRPGMVKAAWRSIPREMHLSARPGVISICLFNLLNLLVSSTGRA